MNHKIVNALSYLSILLLPVIFPLVVWIVAAGEPDLAINARHAFWSQLLPTIMGIALIIVIAVYGLTLGATTGLAWLVILLGSILCLISIVLWFYNIVMGIRSLVA